YLETINGFSVIRHTKQDAFIAGCAFIPVSDDPETNQKLLIPFTAMEATGEVDQRTGLLKYGLAVTRWSIPKPKKHGINFQPEDYIVFHPNFTAIYNSRTI